MLEIKETTKKVPMPNFMNENQVKMQGTKESYHRGISYNGSPGAIADTIEHKDKPDYACYLTECFVNKYAGYVFGFDKWLETSGCKGEIRKKLDTVQYGSKSGTPQEIIDTVMERKIEARKQKALKEKVKAQALADRE